MMSLEPWGGVIQGYMTGSPIRCPACAHIGKRRARGNRLRDVREYVTKSRQGVDLLVTCDDGHNWLLRIEEENGELRAVFVAVDADKKEGDEHV